MTNLELVAAELEAAKQKHPKFVDRFSVFVPKHYDDKLSECRRKNAMYEPTGQLEMPDILQEEMWEAMSAYAHGDIAHARRELAQCAAVCVRAMEYIEKEMEEKK